MPSGDNEYDCANTTNDTNGLILNEIGYYLLFHEIVVPKSFCSNRINDQNSHLFRPLL